MPRQSTFQESNEIIQSLENLNSEIREIWEVLSKQQKEGQKRTGTDYIIIFFFIWVLK